MRRITTAIIGLTISATAALVPASAIAGEKPAQATGGVNYINAAGTPVHLSFTAREPGTGQVQYHGTGGVKFHGVVDCYQQTANGAQFSGYITKTNNDSFTFFRGSVIDNGEPSSGDLVRFGFRPSDVPYDCTRPYAALRPVTSGNLQVHESSSAVTMADATLTSEQEYAGEQE